MFDLILNDKRVECQLPTGTATIDFIRLNKKLAGTKIGCREGDCGACTVLVGELIEGKQQIEYRAMTSCISPIGNMAGKHIVTIEGLNLKDLTPIQEAFVDENGTQCGFCTPGFVVSLVGLCLSDKPKNIQNMIAAMSGNICRCTGYKSIERAAKKIIASLQGLDENNRVGWLIKNNFIPKHFADAPALLKTLKASQVKSTGSTKIIGGGTDLLVQELEKTEDSELELIFDMKDLKGIRIENDRCVIGSATTMSEMKESNVLAKAIPNIDRYMHLVSSTQIRNMATVAGNIANGSPIGDVAIMLQALGSTLHMKEMSSGKKRDVALREFFIGYKQVDLKEGELIEEISFPLLDDNSKFSFEKIGKRIHLDMATVNSAMRIQEKNGVIESASFSVGGLGATILNMQKTSSYLIGKKLDNETFKEANKIAQSEITPRSRPEYKRLLVRQQLLLHLMSFAPSTVTSEAIR